MKLYKLLTLIIILSIPRDAWAGGYEFMGLGARGGAMSGAFVGLADDWTASYWNPAGLAQLKGKGLAFNYWQDWFNPTDSDSAANRDPDDIRFGRGDVFIRPYPSEPPKFGEDEVHAIFIQPSLGGYFPWKGNTVGMSIYTPNGNLISWKDSMLDPVTGARIDAKYDTVFALMVGTASLGREILPNLSLGMGLNVVYGRLGFDVGKTYVGARGVSDYVFDLDSLAQGVGLEGIFGIMYKPTRQISLGAVYRTGANVNMWGKASTRHSLFGTDEDPRFRQNFPLPPTMGLGIAIKPTPQFTFTFDWHSTRWDVMEADINYKRDGVVFRDINTKLDWKRSSRYRFGTEIKLNPKLSHKWGYTYDHSPIPGEQLGITTQFGPYFHSVDWGIGYKWQKWQLEIGFNRHFGERNVAGVRNTYNDGWISVDIIRTWQ